MRDVKIDAEVIAYQLSNSRAGPQVVGPPECCRSLGEEHFQLLMLTVGQKAIASWVGLRRHGAVILLGHLVPTTHRRLTGSEQLSDFCLAAALLQQRECLLSTPFQFVCASFRSHTRSIARKPLLYIRKARINSRIAVVFVLFE